MHCSHPRICWPHTRDGITTVQCQDCPQRVPYDWQRMDTVRDSRLRRLLDGLRGLVGRKELDV